MLISPSSEKQTVEHILKNKRLPATQPDPRKENTRVYFCFMDYFLRLSLLLLLLLLLKTMLI